MVSGQADAKEAEAFQVSSPSLSTHCEARHVPGIEPRLAAPPLHRFRGLTSLVTLRQPRQADVYTSSASAEQLTRSTAPPSAPATRTSSRRPPPLDLPLIAYEPAHNEASSPSPRSATKGSAEEVRGTPTPAELQGTPRPTVQDSGTFEDGSHRLTPRPRSVAAIDATGNHATMSSVDYRPSRSPLAPESSRSASPSGSGASSPPYLRMHSTRAHQSPLSISTSLSSPARSTAPTSPGRAQTHRILGQFPFPADPAAHTSHPGPASQGHRHVAGPSHLSQQIDRDHSATPPPRVNHSSLSTPSASAPATTGYSPSLASPCFVHTHLDHTLHNVAKRDSGSPVTGDKGELYLRGRKKPRARPSESAKDATAKRLGQDGESSTPPVPEEAAESESGSEEESDDEKNNWTRQLAETAVSVREMSKQLGESVCPSRSFLCSR